MTAKADLASGATVEITAVREFTYLGGSRAAEVLGLSY